VRLGIDVGGTFTDLVFLSSDGKILVEKVPSRPDDPFGAILDGIHKLGIPTDQIDEISYGTTIATNCVLERKGAKTGLLCTSGFRDILEHQRWHRRTLYDLLQTRPTPLVPRYLRLEVTERTAADGEVLTEVAEESVSDALARFRDEGVESLAICFLNAHANRQNEAEAKQLARDGGGMAYISVSSEIAPLIREWERTSTTVLNAYTQPMVDRHMRGLRQQMEENGLTMPLDIMQSNGGIISIAEAIDRPIRTILSGPAGGVSGSQIVAGRAGFGDLITFDLGGTSCDVSVIREGVPQVTKEGEVEYNAPITIPMLDIKTIGAGGGSIAWIDRGGIMKVGPRSAGAAPGPASYGRGGQEPTVTDAHLLLGRLPEDGLLGGRMRLDRSAAEAALETKLTGALGLGLIQVSSGIIRIVNINMAEAIRLVTTDRGLDPRDFTLFAFGGGGPLHACELALELGIHRILVPPSPGVLSALGLASADVKTSALTAVNRSLATIAPAQLSSMYDELSVRCLRTLESHDIPADARQILRSADLRYPGQSFEVTVLVPDIACDASATSEIADRFHRTHQEWYKYAMPDQAPFLVNIEVTGIGMMPKPVDKEASLASTAAVPIRDRKVYFLEQNDFLDTPVYRRTNLLPDASFPGPAIVDQFDSAVLVTPEFRARVDAHDNLIIERN
jgi:N-methylhydantoinase A